MLGKLDRFNCTHNEIPCTDLVSSPRLLFRSSFALPGLLTALFCTSVEANDLMMSLRYSPDSFRRITSRGWRSNGILLVSFLLGTAFLFMLLGGSTNDSPDIRVIHSDEPHHELPTIPQVIHVSLNALTSARIYHDIG